VIAGGDWLHVTPYLIHDVLKPCLGAQFDHVGFAQPFAGDDAVPRAMAPTGEEVRASSYLGRRPLNVLVAVIQLLGDPGQLFARIVGWLDKPEQRYLRALVLDVTTSAVPIRHIISTDELERMCGARRIYFTTLERHGTGGARTLHHAIATLVRRAYAQ
jgi:hypothetical protein